MHGHRGLGPALVGALSFILVIPGVAGAQGTELRMVIASGVACRAEPAADAQIQRRSTVGDVFAVGGEDEADGARWYMDRSGGGCWLYGPLTVVYDRRSPQPALMAAADHILAREDSPLMVEWVAVENLLLGDQAPYYGGTSPQELTPLLQLRRLQVVEGALRARDATRFAVDRDPMKDAWMIAHTGLIRGFEPSGGWVMEAETYWDLYERHRDSDAAEEIAWAAANGHVPSDECYTTCVLERIGRTYGRYWRERPNGAHVGEALARSAEQVEQALRSCGDDWDPAQARSLARELLASLQAVPGRERAALATRLEAVERGCRDDQA